MILGVALALVLKLRATINYPLHKDRQSTTSNTAQLHITKSKHDTSPSYAIYGHYKCHAIYFSWFRRTCTSNLNLWCSGSTSSKFLTCRYCSQSWRKRKYKFNIRWETNKLLPMKLILSWQNNNKAVIATATNIIGRLVWRKVVI